MKLISALSLTQHVNEWIANSCHPRILHIFDHACNLINEQKEVLSVVTRQIGNGPFNLVLEEDVSYLEYLNAEAPVLIRDHQLTVGNLNINIGKARLWDPRLDWKELHANRDHIAIQLAQLQITNYQFSNSLAPNFSSALVKAELPSAKNVASKLAGLGIGLTPSGDDFMMGALYAARIVHPPEVASNLVEEIANTAAPLTTSLSAAWLRSAGRGEAGILWHEFLNALIFCRIMEIQEIMNKILAIGETSGSDTMSGFISLFRYWMANADSQGEIR